MITHTARFLLLIAALLSIGRFAVADQRLATEKFLAAETSDDQVKIFEAELKGHVFVMAAERRWLVWAYSQMTPEAIAKLSGRDNDLLFNHIEAAVRAHDTWPELTEAQYQQLWLFVVAERDPRAGAVAAQLLLEPSRQWLLALVSSRSLELIEFVYAHLHRIVEKQPVYDLAELQDGVWYQMLRALLEPRAEYSNLAHFQFLKRMLTMMSYPLLPVPVKQMQMDLVTFMLGEFHSQSPKILAFLEDDSPQVRLQTLKVFEADGRPRQWLAMKRTVLEHTEKRIYQIGKRGIAGKTAREIQEIMQAEVELRQLLLQDGATGVARETTEKTGCQIILMPNHEPE